MIDAPIVMGHGFLVKLGLSYTGGEGKAKGSCTFKWREKTNVPHRSGVPKDQWYDVIEQFPKSLQAIAWRDMRKERCSTTEVIIAPDFAVLQKDRQRPPVTRKTEFEFVLESAPGCFCPSKSITVRAEQVLRQENGTAVWGESYFHEMP